jgi:hypothetical protein
MGLVVGVHFICISQGGSQQTQREGGHEGREDMKAGRRGRGTMDFPNKGEEIAE